MKIKLLLFCLFLMISHGNSFAFDILRVNIEKNDHDDYIFTVVSHADNQIRFFVTKSVKFNIKDQSIIMEHSSFITYKPPENIPEDIESLDLRFFFNGPSLFRKITIPMPNISILVAYERKRFFFNSWNELEEGISEGGTLHSVIGKVEDDNNKQTAE